MNRCRMTLFAGMLTAANKRSMEMLTISDYPDYIDASGGQSYGAFVVKLDADSPAAEAGLKNGDTIIRASSIEVRSLEDLERALTSATGAVAVQVFRDYKHYDLTVNLEGGVR